MINADIYSAHGVILPIVPETTARYAVVGNEQGTSYYKTGTSQFTYGSAGLGGVQTRNVFGAPTTNQMGPAVQINDNLFAILHGGVTAYISFFEYTGSYTDITSSGFTSILTTGDYGVSESTNFNKNAMLTEDNTILWVFNADYRATGDINDNRLGAVILQP